MRPDDCRTGAPDAYDKKGTPTSDIPMTDEEIEKLRAGPHYISELRLILRVDELKAEIKSLEGFKHGVDEALNSGDGVYRP